MESIEDLAKDPLIKVYLKPYSRAEWPDVIKKTLKLGIHSMNTLQSLSMHNVSPSRTSGTHHSEIGTEENSSFGASKGVTKESTGFPAKEPGIINRNDSKLPIKSRKALSLVCKPKGSRTTPKAKKAGFEFFVEKKQSKRVNSMKLKDQLDDTIDNYWNEINSGVEKKNECIKSSKAIKSKDQTAHSAKNSKKDSGGIKRILQDHSGSHPPECNLSHEYHKSTKHCREKPELVTKHEKNSETFVYITSSSESTP